MPSDPITELARATEEDIATFEAKMRRVTPSYRIGEHVEFLGKIFQVESFEADGMPGYWLRRPGRDALFFPLDLEGALQPNVH